MSELRWALAVVGAVFIAALFLWERRKRRDGAAGDRTGYREPLIHDGLHESSESASGTERSDAIDSGWNESGVREPALSLPEMRAREPAHALPVVEIPDDGRYDDLPHTGPIDEGEGESPPQWQPVTAAEAQEAVQLAAAAQPALAAAARVPLPELPPPPDPGALRLEWPDEPNRQIIAVRVLPQGERFLGRTLRQAMAGEGFVHGPLGIFHRALHDGRVVISAASLTKPGSFELASMDAQRYAGINLFAVLPGPIPGVQALEDLVTSARALAARLGGQVQDERGQTLTAIRVAELKAMLAPTLPAAPKHLAEQLPAEERAP